MLARAEGPHRRKGSVATPLLRDLFGHGVWAYSDGGPFGFLEVWAGYLKGAPMRIRIALFAVAMLVLVAGCSSDDGGEADTTSTTPPTIETTTTTVAETTTTTTSAPETTTTSSTLPPVPDGLDVLIESEIVPIYDNWTGTFTATGSAVDEGTVCAAGSLELGRYDQSLQTWRVEVHFICDDGSGGFWVVHDLVPVFGDDTKVEEGTWAVRIGTDSYERLIGNGIELVAPPVDGVFASTMEGHMAITSE